MERLGSADPQRIGAYRLLGRLGAGGMGQVYLARSDRGRTVAIKLVRRELAEQQEFRDRFRQEVEAARQVGSTWTAPVLDADTDAAVPWVATGYVAGPSLQATVSGRGGTPAGPVSGAYGPLPERSVHVLGAGLTRALRAIHSAGLIHRDLKPSNILLTIDGPRVIDFGIARALDTVTDGGLTRTGALVGSPGFMAPEQVRGERVTAACDVFCLGSVLAYAATGRLPFAGADNEVHALMFRIAQEDPDLTGVPADLVDLVRDCLLKDPEARPTTDALLERLADGRADEPWLPGALLAQLGRHAVELLDSEDPEDPVAPEQPAGPQDAVPTAAQPGPDPQPPSHRPRPKAPTHSPPWPEPGPPRRRPLRPSAGRPPRCPRPHPRRLPYPSRLPRRPSAGRPPRPPHPHPHPHPRRLPRPGTTTRCRPPSRTPPRGSRTDTDIRSRPPRDSPTDTAPRNRTPSRTPPRGSRTDTDIRSISSSPPVSAPHPRTAPSARSTPRPPRSPHPRAAGQGRPWPSSWSPCWWRSVRAARCTRS